MSFYPVSVVYFYVVNINQIQKICKLYWALNVGICPVVSFIAIGFCQFYMYIRTNDAYDKPQKNLCENTGKLHASFLLHIKTV
jgi:hypothetical protein